MLEPAQRSALTGLIGFGIGAFLGLVFDAVVNPYITEVNITFNSPNDIVKLKGYSAYYHQRDKNIEDSYNELK